MYSPATRLLTLLELLQSRPGRTAAELSERLEVEARSVRRYVTMLQDMGIPIVAERGRYGGYQLLPGYKLPPLMLSNDEAIAVTLGLLAADRLGLAGALPAVEGALAKVERVLPAEVRERVRAVQGSVTLDLAGEAVFPELQHFLAFSEAAHSRHRVHMSYHRPEAAPTEREFDCYGLLYHAGAWYAVGYCHLRSEVRVFRLDRIAAVAAQEDTFVRPDGFDCLAFAVARFAAMPDTWLIEVLLDTTMDAVRAAIPPSFATLEETRDGVLLRTYDSNLAHTARFLIGLGCRFRVLQPDELRDALRLLANDVLAMAQG
ncbi:MAG TPA: YafY family protein [Ktedonobacterales bacterium]|jgi:predicted DNA-binding transcriptional regulator YafY|nr:YafY family protein [Ktedonobacterales bacterium]